MAATGNAFGTSILTHNQGLGVTNLLYANILLGKFTNGVMQHGKHKLNKGLVFNSINSMYANVIVS